MSAHSIIAPSAAGIWGKPNGCTAYPLMAQQHPETEESEDAKEGTASHEGGQKLIEAAKRGTQLKQSEIVGKTAENGIIFTDEMFEGAEIYANDVIEVMRSTRIFGGENLGIEQHLVMPSIHELSHGTPDMFIFDRENFSLYIWDYKFGHEVVEAFENWQMMNYISGIIEKLNIGGLEDQVIKVYIRVIQPRAFHREGIIREWKVKLSDLRPHFNILNSNAHKALSGDAECHTGSHCKNCCARHACQPALQVGLRLYEITRRPVAIELDPMAIGIQLGIIKRALKQLEYMESGFETQVESLIRSGVDIPGWIVEMSKGREKWSKPVKEVLQLGEMLNVDLKKPDEAVTPNAARKLGIDDAVIKAYSVTPSKGLKIVQDNGNKAKKVFYYENVN